MNIFQILYKNDETDGASETFQTSQFFKLLKLREQSKKQLWKGPDTRFCHPSET